MRSDLGVETDFCSLSIRSVASRHSAILRQDYWPLPRIEARVGAEPVKWQSDMPLFFEDAEYRLTAQSKIPGEAVSVHHRDPRVTTALSPVEGADRSIVVGNVKFSQQVGLSEFTIQVGADRLHVILEVFPAKLDYMSDFEAMLQDLAALDRLLPLSYFESTQRWVGQSDDAFAMPTEWVSVLRTQMQSLEEALQYAELHPLHTLDDEVAHARLDEIEAASDITVEAIRTGQGAGEWLSIPAIGRVRERVPTLVSRDSLDSKEHRWLKAQVSLTAQELDSIANEMEEAQARIRRAPGARRTNLARQSEIEEVRDLANRMGALLSIAILDEASIEFATPGYSSLRLQQTPGYSEAYRILSSLRQGLVLAQGTQEISTEKLSVLYEAWCFVAVVKVLRGLSVSVDSKDVETLVTRQSLSSRLIKGVASRIRFNMRNDRSVALIYNRSYPTPTGTCTPDIVLQVSDPGVPDVLVILDAKYQVDPDPERRDATGIAPPPESAINALHRYRDAILVGGSGSSGSVASVTRPVVRGAALYPLARSESLGYVGSALEASLTSVGIGAIPFLPGNTSYVDTWLDSVLALPRADFIWPGPPHPSS